MQRVDTIITISLHFAFMILWIKYPYEPVPLIMEPEMILNGNEQMQRMGKKLKNVYW